MQSSNQLAEISCVNNIKSAHTAKAHKVLAKLAAEYPCTARPLSSKTRDRIKRREKINHKTDQGQDN